MSNILWLGALAMLIYGIYSGTVWLIVLGAILLVIPVIIVLLVITLFILAIFGITKVSREGNRVHARWPR